MSAAITRAATGWVKALPRPARASNRHSCHARPATARPAKTPTVSSPTAPSTARTGIRGTIRRASGAPAAVQAKKQVTAAP
ncbi:hypothetical protein DC74_6426 [Streptomyces noursei]|nr:hypothetical protein DC74_6426 [Streptomyces noursei]